MGSEMCIRDRMEAAIVETGPETVAMIIAEPVQNAGGAFVPPDGYWTGSAMIIATVSGPVSTIAASISATRRAVRAASSSGGSAR